MGSEAVAEQYVMIGMIQYNPRLDFSKRGFFMPDCIRDYASPKKRLLLVIGGFLPHPDPGLAIRHYHNNAVKRIIVGWIRR